MRSPEPRLIGRALRLDRADGLRALRALGWLVAAGAAVRIVPYATVTRTIARIPASRSPRGRITPDQCAVAIRRARQVWPAAHCLPQAIAGYCLLRRAGRVPFVRLGVAIADTRFDAHAWLECEGVTVTGGDIAHRYAPLTSSARDPTS